MGHSSGTYSFTRLFFLKKNITCKEIHLTIFKQLYRIFTTFDNPKQRPLDMNKLKQEYEKNFINEDPLY